MSPFMQLELENECVAGSENPKSRTGGLSGKWAREPPWGSGEAPAFCKVKQVPPRRM